jgi:nucleotidyltransferase substrate binding protein (TIGR01987 family)
MNKYEKFHTALENLKEIYRYEPPYNTVILTGLVGLYEICFEQSWKLMKELLEVHGYPLAATGSPRMIVKTAYQAGMIQDEALWISALQSRNLVSHSYNQNIAYDIVLKSKELYYPLFCELEKQIQDNWMLL